MNFIIQIIKPDGKKEIIEVSGHREFFFQTSGCTLEILDKERNEPGWIERNRIQEVKYFESEI